MRGVRSPNAVPVPKVQGLVVSDPLPPVRRRRCVQVVQTDGVLEGRNLGDDPFLHLTHTPTCPHSGRDYGYPIYWARYGGSGVSGLEPLATVAKLFELVLRHGERDRECAKWVLDGDGLAVTKRGEA